MKARAYLIPLLAVVLAAGSGCALTVTPAPVTSSVASFDGNVQNSGYIKSTPEGGIVTPHFRDRYNALVESYGKAFTPALTKDSGFTPLPDGTWLIDREHIVKMWQMNAWRKTGRPAVSP